MVPLYLVWSENPQDPGSWGRAPVLHGVLIDGENSRPRKLWFRSTALERSSQEDLVSLRFYFSCPGEDLESYLFDELPSSGGGLFVSFDNEATWVRIDRGKGTSPDTAILLPASSVSLLAASPGQLRPGDVGLMVLQIRRAKARESSRLVVAMHCLFDCM